MQECVALKVMGSLGNPLPQLLHEPSSSTPSLVNLHSQVYNLTRKAVWLWESLGLEQLPLSWSSLGSSLKKKKKLIFLTIATTLLLPYGSKSIRIFSTSSILLSKLGFSISKPSRATSYFSNWIPKMGFRTVRVSPYIVTMALSCGNQTFRYKDEGTASVS